MIQVVAAGFNPTSKEVDNLHKDYRNGGIFVISDEEEKLIKSSMENLKCSNKEKFRHVLGYQMELGYDLCLAPGDVVSTNPGYEMILGVTETTN